MEPAAGRPGHAPPDPAPDPRARVSDCSALQTAPLAAILAGRPGSGREPGPLAVGEEPQHRLLALRRRRRMRSRSTRPPRPDDAAAGHTTAETLRGVAPGDNRRARGRVVDGASDDDDGREPLWARWADATLHRRHLSRPSLLFRKGHILEANPMPLPGAELRRARPPVPPRGRRPATSRWHWPPAQASSAARRAPPLPRAARRSRGYRHR
jgi:hypothetical protein